MPYKKVTGHAQAFKAKRISLFGLLTAKETTVWTGFSYQKGFSTAGRTNNTLRNGRKNTSKLPGRPAAGPIRFRRYLEANSGKCSLPFQGEGLIRWVLINQGLRPGIAQLFTQNQQTPIRHHTQLHPRTADRPYQDLNRSFAKKFPNRHCRIDRGRRFYGE